MMRNNDEGQYNRQQEQARKGVIMRKGILVIEKSEQQPHTHTQRLTPSNPQPALAGHSSPAEKGQEGKKRKGLI